MQFGAAGFHPPNHGDPIWLAPHRGRRVCTLTRTHGDDWAVLSTYVLIGDLGLTNSASASRSARKPTFLRGSLGAARPVALRIVSEKAKPGTAGLRCSRGKRSARQLERESMSTFLQYLSAGFAVAAAALWFWSAKVRLPEAVRHIDYGHVGDRQPKPTDDLDRLTSGLARQSRLSAQAAICAGASALLQGLLTTFG